MIYCLKWICILIIFGTFIQYTITKIEDIKYPSPGKMIDIGGYMLHINLMGDNINYTGPTIVLDMGLGGNLLYWSHVQREIAKFARVVSYDRAGIGWSDKSPLARSSHNIVKELHTLLHKAEIPEPYILVGHSFGGITSRIYANYYPDEVAGIILVDSSHEDQLEILPKPTDFISRILNSSLTHPFVIMSARIGLLRLYNLFNYKKDVFDSKTHKMIAAKESTNKFIDVFLEEWSSFESNLYEAKSNQYNLKDIPLIVITAAMTPSKETCAKYGHDFPEKCNLAYKVWHSLQKDLTTKSTNSLHFMAYNSGHIIQQDEPQIIIEAVKTMLNL